MKYLLIICLSLLGLTCTAQSIEGVWKSYDDNTGELKAEIKITIKNDKLYGKIIKLHNLKVPLKDVKCYDCTDYRKDQPLTGMEIITGLKKSGEYWTGDNALLDPKNGKLYDAKFWLENDNKLAVRGYIGWFFRTQYWIRAK